MFEVQKCEYHTWLFLIRGRQYVCRIDMLDPKVQNVPYASQDIPRLPGRFIGSCDKIWNLSTRRRFKDHFTSCTIPIKDNEYEMLRGIEVIEGLPEIVEQYWIKLN